MDLIAMLGTALGIALALTSLSAGLITVQVAILVLIISYEFFRPLRLLGSYFHFAMQGLSASKSILMILAQETTHDKRVEARGLEMGLNHDIEFKDVAFSYGDGSPKVLKDVSFKSETGRITAIVGLSGSGKTTIANLITKLYEPDSGKVLIGNRNLQTIDRNSIRNRISMISQRSFLFHGTIRENLLIAKPDATDDELYQACQRAGIIDFVNSLRNGLDSSLTEQARNISDGQVQRIAIARTLLRDSPILILDEPTSNVDSANEETILRTLKEITKQKTTILIAHRLSTVCDCDKIIVIEDGCVVEEGTHRELMARDGVYAELFHDQAMFDLLHRQQVTIVQ
jgi:ATP-binding cassette subfamily C protein